MHKFTPRQRLLIALLLISVLLTLWLTTVNPASLGAQLSPAQTPTRIPTLTPTDTPVPTGEPTQAPTATPIPATNTPGAPTETPFIPTDTPIPPIEEEFTPTLPPGIVTDTPILPTFTPLPPQIIETPTPIFPLPGIVTQEPTSALQLNPTPGTITSTENVTNVVVIDENSNTSATNPDNLVRVIDAFVLYSAYFALGCGLLIFIVIAVGLFLLSRYGRYLSSPDDAPPVEE